VNEGANAFIALDEPVSVEAHRSLNVITGTLSIRRKIVSCLVIGESWPSWLSTACALAGVENVKSYFGSTSSAELLGLPSVDWTDLEVRKKVAEEWSSFDVVFLSGRLKFVQAWAGMEVPIEKALITVDFDKKTDRRLSPPAKDKVEWSCESHVEFGGATSARCWVGIGRGLVLVDGPLLEGTARRSLMDYLSTTVSGPPVQVTEEQIRAARFDKANKPCWTDGVLGAQGVLDVYNSGAMVLAPCVFTKSRWTKRKLEIGELTQLWDLPVEWKKRFNDCSQNSLPFLRSAPAKILWGIASKVKAFGLQSIQKLSKGNLAGNGYGWVDQDIIEERAKIDAKAAKNDDAGVDYGLWNEYALRGSSLVRSERVDAALEVLRKRMLLWWMRNLRRDFCRFLRKQHGAEWWSNNTRECRIDWEKGLEALFRCWRANWWEWSDGSTLLFWRWAKEFRSDARDGMKIRVQGTLPRNRVKQRVAPDETTKAQVKEKIVKVLDRRYIGIGEVKSLTNFFHVPKGEGDIRMVYDATKSGLNDAVWAPSFGMPTVNSALDHVCSDTFMADADLGEYFLNFPLDVNMQPYSGLDVSSFGLSGPDWAHWMQMFMGFKPSPYVTIRQRLLIEDVVRGNHLDPANPYHWTEVVQNLPGKESYDPTMPWVYKTKEVGGKRVLASNHASFCDDLRGSGPTEEDCWSVTRRVAEVLQWFGIQDAPRKRRPPSQSPGAWAGAVIRIVKDGVGVSVSEEKWQKTKEILARWLADVEAHASRLDRKDLESDRGFLVYVAQTFPVLKSYLKGINLTLESWRSNRCEEGWKLPMEIVTDGEGVVLGTESDPAAPAAVKAVPRLLDDLQAMAVLTEGDRAPMRIVRPRYKLHIKYGFGDASGAGFGATITTDEGIRIRFGVWGADENKQSSNYRELRNLVEALEDLWEKGELTGVEIFIFTDNSTAEATFYKGTSSNPLLFELVLRLKKLEMEAGAKIHLIHCAGTRQIVQGADGLSRGDLTEGVMSGIGMLAFVPLHLGAFERASAGLLDWIRNWTNCSSLEALTPDQWYSLGHGVVGGELGPGGLWFPRYEKGTRLWAPAPAAARPVVEQLREARHKHQDSTHVFVCPRLMCYEWRKPLLKEADFVFYLPAGAMSFWPKEMYEPLLIAVCLPFIRHAPWKLQRMPRLLDMERRVRCLLKDDGGDPGSILRKLCELPRQLDKLSPELVQQVLRFKQPIGLSG